MIEAARGQARARKSPSGGENINDRKERVRAWREREGLREREKAWGSERKWSKGTTKQGGNVGEKRKRK